VLTAAATGCLLAAGALAVFSLAVLQLQRREAWRVEAAVRGERMRIARELHDVAGHRLLAITLHARSVNAGVDGRCPTADAIEELARLTMRDIRDMIGVLRHRRPAAGPLHRCVAEMAAQFPVGIGVELDNVDREHQVGPEVRATALRVLQEGVTNAIKHGAGPIRVGLHFGDHLVVSVYNRLPEDVPATGTRSDSYGLRGLGERVSAHGGTLAYGRVGDEFLVRARIPVTRLVCDEVREALWTASVS
jgi:signal transduction histidine kinase